MFRAIISLTIITLQMVIITVTSYALPLKTQIEIDKTVVEAGDILRGDDIHALFTVRNIGSSDLHISTRSNCGCVTVINEERIPPGAEGKIDAIVHTGSLIGKVSKGIELITDDPDHPYIMLEVKANMLEYARFEPDPLPVMRPSTIKNDVVQVSLAFQDDSEVQILQTRSNVPWAKCDVIKQPQFNKYSLNILVYPTAPLGAAPFNITFHTDSKRQPDVVLQLQCENGIICTPKEFYFGRLKSGSSMPVSRIITLYVSKGDFQIRKIQCLDPALKISVDKDITIKGYRVKVTYRGGWKPGTISTKIIVMTDQPRQQRIVIPVQAVISGPERGSR